jgi:outer membrane protein insertion porin family
MTLFYPIKGMPMTRSRKYLVALFSFFLAGSCLFSNGFANEGEIIADVVILGNRTVDDAVIMSKVKTRAGNKYAQLDINEDLKRLYALGYFTNISVDVSPIANGLKVAFIVKEKPFLKDILLEGNKVFKNDKILNAMESKVNRVLDESKVKADIEVVRNLYQGKGYYSADIAYKITTDEKSGRAILAIRIEEGQKLHIKEVQLVGVKAFKERKVRGVMKTKNRWLLRPGFLKEEELRNDLDRVRALYVSKGYIDV